MAAAKKNPKKSEDEGVLEGELVETPAAMDEDDAIVAELVEDGLAPEQETIIDLSETGSVTKPDSSTKPTPKPEVVPEKIPPRKSSALAIRGGDISSRDPLASYMRDVQRYPLLTREEEKELAEHYVKTGDVTAARQLVTANLRLVVKIAYEYRQAYKNLLDLVQEGNIGLMQAVKKFDPYKGVKLSSYAAWWIRAYMLRFILNNHRLVKLGTTQAQRKLFFNLQKEKSRLAAMGIEPTHEKIAASLDVPLKDVVSMDRRLSSGEASLDAPVHSQGDEGRMTSRVEMLDGGGPALDDVLAQDEVGERVRTQIAAIGDTLEGREKIIFEKRLLSDEPMTLQELGTEFGVSRERVRQLEKRLLGKLGTALRESLGEEITAMYEA